MCNMDHMVTDQGEYPCTQQTTMQDLIKGGATVWGKEFGGSDMAANSFVCIVCISWNLRPI